MAADTTPQLGGVFLATFHVRTGNSLAFAHPPPLAPRLAAASAEWKALPSGSHAVQRDTVFFAVGDRALAAAAFRNVALGAGDGSAQEQRGARMLSVGAVVEGSRPPAPALLRALDAVADSIAASAPEGDTQAQDELTRWYDEQQQQQQQRTPVGSSSDDAFTHSALSHLPALASALGPLLPPLLKRLATHHTRLLIYSAPPLLPAAALAHNIADIILAARTRSAAAAARTAAPPAALPVRGLVTLHDIAALTEESLDRDSDAGGWIAITSDTILLDKCALFDVVLDLTPLQPSRESRASATPAASSSTSSKPRLRVVSAPTSSASGPQARLILKDISWTTQEYAEMRVVEDKVKRKLSALDLDDDVGNDGTPASPTPAADPPVAVTQRVSAVRKRTHSGTPTTTSTSPARRPRPLSSSAVRTQSRGVFLNLLAMLRYVFAQTLWFFPSVFWTPASASASASALSLLGASRAPGGSSRRARVIAGGDGASDTTSLAESAFILPLGVRPDGGLRASVLINDDDDDDEEEDSGDEDGSSDRGSGAGVREDGESEDAADTLTGRSEATAIPRAEQQLIDLDEPPPPTRRRRSSAALQNLNGDDNGGVGYDDADAELVSGLPDPFLAACGAATGKLAEQRRASVGTSLRVRGSRASLRPAAADEQEEEGDEDEGPTGTGHAGEQSDADEHENGALSRALARQLHAAWTDWLAVLLLEISALLREASSAGDSPAPARELDGTDFASIGLSTRNGADCALVKAVGREVLGREVGIRRWTWRSVFG